MSGLFPAIPITGVTAFAAGGIWTASVTGSGYTVGLIPGSSGSTELSSLLASPQGDIYDAAAGVGGNSIATLVAITVPPDLKALRIKRSVILFSLQQIQYRFLQPSGYLAAACSV